MSSEREEPWREIPEWFYDKTSLSNKDIGNDEILRAYAQIQRYFGRSISPRAVDEFFFGTSITGISLSSFQCDWSTQARAKGELMLKAMVKLPTGHNGFIRQTFHQQKRRTVFDYLKPERNDEKFPKGFGREYFRHYIPALREMEIRTIDIKACSNPSAGMNGAYTWCFYGFTNRRMKDTLQNYIIYLENYHGIFLDGRERNAIMKIDRMGRLLKEQFAEEFLRAQRQGTMIWPGTIPDIFDEETIEMRELIDYLQGEK
jgi:hypothetical protein